MRSNYIVYVVISSSNSIPFSAQSNLLSRHLIGGWIFIFLRRQGQLAIPEEKYLM